MSLESKLDKWSEQPGAVVTSAEREFIEDMRKAAAAGVGYGWMQQVIEWEWQAKFPLSWGPEYYEATIKKLEDQLAQRRDGDLKRDGH